MFGLASDEVRSSTGSRGAGVGKFGAAESSLAPDHPLLPLTPAPPPPPTHQGLDTADFSQLVQQIRPGTSDAGVLYLQAMLDLDGDVRITPSEILEVFKQVWSGSVGVGV